MGGKEQVGVIVRCDVSVYKGNAVKIDAAALHGCVKKVSYCEMRG